MHQSALRTGNWVYYEEAIDHLEPKKINEYDIVNFYKFRDKYFPIPLSDFWFKKLGFKRHQDGDYILGEFTIITLGTALPEDERSYTFDNYEIKYVHQLQNLYYDLIQNELIYSK